MEVFQMVDWHVLMIWEHLIYYILDCNNDQTLQSYHKKFLRLKVDSFFN